jgi:hypothetical protein
MLRRVVLVRTDISEELSASIIRVTTTGELETMLTLKNGVFWDVTPCGSCKNRRFVTLIKEALGASVTSVLPRATRRKIPEDTILHSQRRENLKSYNVSPN